MLRELEDREISAVSGGDIVVTGSSLSALSSMMGSGFGIVSGFTSLFQDLDQIEARLHNWVDIDEDGVPDSPEIVVQSPLTLSQIRDANQFAINQAQWSYFEAGIIAAIATKGLTFWASLGISSTMSVPPVSNTVTDANAEFIFASIVAAGGLNNYIATNPSTAYNNP